MPSRRERARVGDDERRRRAAGAGRQGAALWRRWRAGRCEQRPVKVWVPACTRQERVKVYRKGHWETRNVRTTRPAPSKRVVVETHRDRGSREVRGTYEVRPVRTYRPRRHHRRGGRVTLEFGN